MKNETRFARLVRRSVFFLKNSSIVFRRMLLNFLPIRKDYRQWDTMNLRQWQIHHQINTVFDRSFWMGHKVLKNPLDLWIYQEIIYGIRPDIIIEIGSYEGGSTLYFAHLLDILGNGEVISIDIDRSGYKVTHPRILEITGDSSSEEVISRVTLLCKDKTVLIVHDGDHQKKQVLKDLRAYEKLVSVNSYLIVEDGIVDLFRPASFPCWSGEDEGPLSAVEEFLKENGNFIVDIEKERYIITNNPKGFLKRIK